MAYRKENETKLETALKGIIPKGGWVAPPNARVYGEDHLTDEAFRDLAESGINVAYPVISPETDYADLIRFFDLSEKYGVYVVVPEESISTTDFDAQAVAKRLAEYNGRKCVIGINVRDEPGYDAIPVISANLSAVAGAIGRLAVYCNQMPLYAKDSQIYGAGANSTEEISVGRYERFLDRFYGESDFSVFSYDFYPFRGEKGKCHSKYFLQLCVARRKADKFGIPLWNFTQVTSWSKGVIRNVTYSEIAWMNNTSIACGVTGLQYFCYWTPRSDVEVFDSAMISDSGEKTESYYLVRKANERLSHYEEKICASKYVGTIAVGDTLAPFPNEYACKNFGNISRVESRSALIGCLNGKSSHIYYVVNASVTETVTVAVRFKREITVTVYDGAEKKVFTGETLILAISEGEAVLVEDNNL